MIEPPRWAPDAALEADPWDEAALGCADAAVGAAPVMEVGATLGCTDVADVAAPLVGVADVVPPHAARTALPAAIAERERNFRRDNA